MARDRDLVQALERVRPIEWSGEVLRHHTPRYRPLDGAGARVNGGRWNPPGSFPVVYTALDRATVDAEFVRLTRRAGMPASSLLPRRLTTIRVRLARVLDLTDAGTRRRLGINLAVLRAEDWATTQAIGQAAHDLGYDGILAPGADGGTVLAIFSSGPAAGATLRVVGETDYLPPSG